MRAIASGMLRLVLTMISVAAMTVVLAACGDDAPATVPPEVATPPTAVPPAGEREARVLTPSGSEGECAITPRQTEGPYYLDVGQVRRDITEGKLGTPLLVRLHLVEAGSCAPIGDASVDIWHTDAEGQYSGFGGQGDDGTDTSGETFLRGTQVTDAERAGGVRDGLPWVVSRQDCSYPLQGLYGRGESGEFTDVLPR